VQDCVGQENSVTGASFQAIISLLLYEKPPWSSVPYVEYLLEVVKGSVRNFVAFVQFKIYLASCHPRDISTHHKNPTAEPPAAAAKLTRLLHCNSSSSNNNNTSRCLYL
jgi:hypothetical protein